MKGKEHRASSLLRMFCWSYWEVNKTECEAFSAIAAPGTEGQKGTRLLPAFTSSTFSAQEVETEVRVVGESRG